MTEHNKFIEPLHEQVVHILVHSKDGKTINTLLTRAIDTYTEDESIENGRNLAQMMHIMQMRIVAKELGPAGLQEMEAQAKEAVTVSQELRDLKNELNTNNNEK